MTTETITTREITFEVDFPLTMLDSKGMQGASEDLKQQVRDAVEYDKIAGRENSVEGIVVLEEALKTIENTKKIADQILRRLGKEPVS